MGFNLRDWEGYAAKISPSLPTLCKDNAADYYLENVVTPIINACLSNERAVSEVRDSFRYVTQNLAAACEAGLGETVDCDVILYLGLCNGAGWVTTIDGRRVILLGIEKIVELSWQSREKMRAFIYHEIGHVWHMAVGTLYWGRQSPGEKWLNQLYYEGIAMFCEQILMGDMDYYHQYGKEWKNWCATNRQELFQEFRHRVDDEVSAQDFFGDWVSYEGHSDVGYFLGCELIKAAAMEFSLNELASLDYETVYKYLEKLCN